MRSVGSCLGAQRPAPCPWEACSGARSGSTLADMLTNVQGPQPPLQATARHCHVQQPLRRCRAAQVGHGRAAHAGRALPLELQRKRPGLHLCIPRLQPQLCSGWAGRCKLQPKKFFLNLLLLALGVRCWGEFCQLGSCWVSGRSAQAAALLRAAFMSRLLPPAASLLARHTAAPAARCMTNGDY